MAKRIKAGIKDAKQNIKRRELNRYYKTRIKNLIKEATDAKTKDEFLEKANSAISFIDHAVSKGALHKNTAARKKSNLMKEASRF
ncbi:MAG: 30S ribosomal protein S20 [Caldisericia bacterium]